MVNSLCIDKELRLLSVNVSILYGDGLISIINVVFQVM